MAYNDDLKATSERIKRLRKYKGYTQEQFAKLLGISTMTLRRYESGTHSISEKMLDKIFELLLQPDETDEIIDACLLDDDRKETFHTLPAEAVAVLRDTYRKMLDEHKKYCDLLWELERSDRHLIYSLIESLSNK